MESRKRCCNFTTDEKISVLELVKEYKNILECKKSDSVTWRDKDIAWEEITARFNASNTVLAKRSKENLKKLYENKKKETRKMAAAERLERFKTGGGPSTPKVEDPTFDLTMSILNKKSVSGLPSIFDGDADAENIIIKIVDDNEDTAPEGSFPQTHAESEESIDWGNFKTEFLKTPVSKKLQSSNIKSSSSRQRLCTSSSTLATKYEDLADIKKELGKLQIQILKDEKRMREEKHLEEIQNLKMKAIREEEEFNLRKEGLKLDIKIKNEQLKALQNF